MFQEKFSINILWVDYGKMPEIQAWDSHCWNSYRKPEYLKEMYLYIIHKLNLSDHMQKLYGSTDFTS